MYNCCVEQGATEEDLAAAALLQTWNICHILNQNSSNRTQVQVKVLNTQIHTYTHMYFKAWHIHVLTFSVQLQLEYCSNKQVLLALRDIPVISHASACNSVRRSLIELYNELGLFSDGA